MKAHVLGGSPKLLKELHDGNTVMRHVREAINLTEAPEDAVCSLVIDLMHYCEHENIDWIEDVISRVQQRM